MLRPSTISSELRNSGLRAPEPSPIRVPRGTTRPNSDDDDDDDDVRLTHSQSRASAEADQLNTNTDREVRDGPLASSSSQPKADNTSVPAAVGTGTPKVPFSLSLTLRNTGSVARDHLASERTFLAYVRTSLSFASAGVGSTTSASPNQPVVASYARPLGATLIAFGMAVLGMGTYRYFLIQRLLPQGVFPAARFSVFLQAVSLAALTGIVFGILVAVR
ncbi:hypothetical protein BGY98DRAFT_920005 [Russula aff. rugulosa BPL654]|nr:hypothetical protein BGY98DRAFT_920005 [Russula aff. rugulosa BPL654]